MLQEILDKEGNSKLLSFTIPSLSKPSVYHEVRRPVCVYGQSYCFNNLVNKFKAFNHYHHNVFKTNVNIEVSAFV